MRQGMHQIQETCLQTRPNECLHGFRIENRLGVWQLSCTQVFRTAIDNYDLASDKARRITEQKDSSIRDVALVPESARRKALVSVSAFGAKTVHTFSPTNGTGGNDVGTDTL